ncbi:type II toxin-antitoxin system antitoxin SocA domain-containing protein [Staphylococcus pseudintermedius]|uniref:type II toxin-antitoxin system antitoxin SocA domain-containing protein n=1 Tax=Staphylococcus pseudintermedius TaxID=283734 RepID=UPI001C1F785C|nr:DUF4065 domain-containing protein [Staphylococcus pseudintermedius]
MTIYSEEIKLKKLKWLKINGYLESMSPLQIQKFLFFSEMFNLVTNEDYTLHKLKAYKNGPVFSDVYGDITYRKSELLTNLDTIDMKYNSTQEENLNKALFITNTQTDKDLSDITHNLDLWYSKIDLINQNVQHISITDKDITDKDKKSITNFREYASYLSDYQIIKIKDKIFLINNNDIDKLEDRMLQTMEMVSDDDNLVNPVYVDIEDGVLLID